MNVHWQFAIDIKTDESIKNNDYLSNIKKDTSHGGYKLLICEINQKAKK